MEGIGRKFQLSLVITRRCNLNCVYCYEKFKSDSVMDLDTAKSAIAECLNSSGYQFVEIALFGGEPFLEFELLHDVCEWTWSKTWNTSYVFFIDTNGTLLDSNIKQWLVKNKQRLILGLSLDGDRKTHNTNRSDSFDLIDLDFFRKHWPKQPVKVTISDLNLGHLAKDIVFIHKNGFRMVGCNFASGKEIMDFDDKIEVIVSQLNILIDFYLDNPNIEISPLLNYPLWKCELKPQEPQKICGVGENMVLIDVNGEKYPCSYFSPLTIPKSLLQSFNINYSDYNLFVDNDCEKSCYIYPICRGCYGDNLVSTGMINKRSYQKCMLNKIFSKATAKLMAKKLLSKDLKDITEIDKYTIKAISQIIEKY